MFICSLFIFTVNVAETATRGTHMHIYKTEQQVIGNGIYIRDELTQVEQYTQLVVASLASKSPQLRGRAHLIQTFDAE